MFCSWWVATMTGTGGEEQQCLKKAWVIRVEDGPFPGTDPRAREHVADLAHGGVG